MFILYFYGMYHEYHHARAYRDWTGYGDYRPGESLWLVPGTDPEDDAYGRHEADDQNEGDENDETLEYMVDLLEAHEIEPSEFRQQLLSVGYHPETVSAAISQVAA